MGSPNYVLNPEEIARQQAAEAVAPYLAEGGYSPKPPPPQYPASGDIPPAGPPPPPPSPPYVSAPGEVSWKHDNELAAERELGDEHFLDRMHRPPQGEEDKISVVRPAALAAEIDRATIGGAPEERPAGRGEASAARGGGGVIPGGWSPSSRKQTVQEGVPVPDAAKEAYGAATALEADAAGGQREADKALYERSRGLEEQRLKAIGDAAVAHEDVQSRRDAEVRDRLAEIESTNQQVGAQIDPEKFWHDRGALASVIGAIAVALGAAGASITKGPNAAQSIFDAAINRDVSAQLANREGARGRMQGQERLLDLHLKRLGAEDTAIDATKLAYYDNIATQLKAYAAEHAGQVSDVAFSRVMGNLLTRRADQVRDMAKQEAGKVVREGTETYRQAQVVGGAGGAIDEPPNLITLPDGTTVQMPNKEIYDKAVGSIQVKRQLQRMTNEMISLRKQAEQIDPTLDYTKFKELSTKINELGQRKMEVVSIAAGQGVLRESDVRREENYGVDPMAGLGQIEGRIPIYSDAARRAADEALKRDVQRYDEDITEDVKGAGSHVMHRGFVGTPGGGLRPAAKYTGQNVAPDSHLAPRGFRPADPSETVPTQGVPIKDTAETGDYFGAAVQAAAAAKKKRGKK